MAQILSVNTFKSLDHFEIDEIKVFVDISLSNFNNRCLAIKPIDIAHEKDMYKW